MHFSKWRSCGIQRLPWCLWEGDPSIYRARSALTGVAFAFSPKRVLRNTPTGTRAWAVSSRSQRFRDTRMFSVTQHVSALPNWVDLLDHGVLFLSCYFPGCAIKVLCTIFCMWRINSLLQFTPCCWFIFASLFCNHKCWEKCQLF